MTRMLFWNVDQYGADRFNSVSSANDPFAGKSQQAAAVDRLALFRRVIEAANPDIVVIVEVVARKWNSSALIAPSSGGLKALNQLLGWLRTVESSVQSPEWRLVPPLFIEGNSGSGEAVGVLYRGVTGDGADKVTRYFTGPNLWHQGYSKQPPNGGQSGPYKNFKVSQTETIPYGTFLVPPPGTQSRKVPPGALHNGDKYENNLAARIQFRDPAQSLNADAFLSFGTLRPPYMVTFTEQKGDALRDLTVFCVHGPAKAEVSAAYITTLSTMVEITSPIGARETRMIGGDFNNNLLGDDGNLSKTYDPLTSLQYQLLLRPAGDAPGDLDSYLGYFGTKIQPLAPSKQPPGQATKLLWSDGGNLSYYPGYGYLPPGFNSLDNVLVKPRIVDRNYQTTIFNTVVSSPLNAVADPAGNPPIGSLRIDSAMPDVPEAWQPWPKQPTVPTYDATAAAKLLEWPRYPHIVSTSDHFALFVDV